MEEKKLDKIPTQEELIQNHMNELWEDLINNKIIHCKNFNTKYRSIRRAIKRGHLTIFGMAIPKRPFNNRANTCKRKGKHSRITNELKKHYYESIKRRIQ